MNIAAHLSRAAALSPERPAIVSAEVARTYRELDERASRVASSLLRHGLSAGDRVAIVLRNGPDYLAILYGVLRAGMVAVPLNPRLHRDEVAGIARDCGCRAVFASPDPDSAKGYADTGLFVPSDALEAFIASGKVSQPDAPVDLDAPAWLFYTSGTTGRPKGAVLSHHNLQRMVMACLADVVDYRRDDVVLHAAPLSHGAGLYALPGVVRGVTHVIPELPTFDAATVLELIERHRVSVISFLTPTMITRLLDEPSASTRDLSSLRSISYGGGPAYTVDIRRAIGRFGPILSQLYGQGESPMTISYLPATDHQTDSQLSSVGIPHPDVEVGIFDEAGSPVANGEPGEICVRGDVVMRGYWNDPVGTEAALRDGWLRTGDVGRFDRQGYLFLLDRLKDLIISGGSNIYSREVEEVLLQHPAVTAAVVVGLPDPLWGESVHAVVVVRPDQTASQEDLIRFCKSRIASYKKPRTIDFVADLPVGATGKVVRRLIRDEAIHRKSETQAKA
jgi:acyl-CoA synthetase (AMP-forming)/AMP-acid ligase II